MVKRAASPGPSNVKGSVDHPVPAPEAGRGRVETVIELIAATGFWPESRLKLMLCCTNLCASYPPSVSEAGTCFKPRRVSL